MIAAVRPARASNPRQCLGRRKHHASNSRVGQVASPLPQLKEATNPAHTTITVAGKNRVDPAHIVGNRRKARAAPAIAKEFSQLKPPDAVIAARPIQKLPTITTRVDMIFAVRPTVLSRQIGVSSSAAVITSSATPAMKSGSWSPRKNRRSASHKKVGKNSE